MYKQGSLTPSNIDFVKKGSKGEPMCKTMEMAFLRYPISKCGTGVYGVYVSISDALNLKYTNI
jgi:hypothetical protein